VRTAASAHYLPVGGAHLYVREIGVGPPVVVLHGGPDFDHCYLLPELDELAAACRLIYYDQRGRGRSAPAVQVADVSIESEVADLDRLRQHLGLTTVTLLGHSWGGVVAMEYAIAHPELVSQLLLLGTAPASAAEAERLFRHWRVSRTESELEQLARIAATPAFRDGDPAADIEYYRVHYRNAVRRPQDLDRLAARFRAHFDAPGVRLARAIEQRLYEQTWDVSGYDLVPKLAALPTPATVLHGEHDIVPLDMAARIADAMPQGRLVVLPECAHFPFLDDPALVRNVVAGLLGTSD